LLALLSDPAPRLTHDHPAPVPKAGEALLRMRVAGVCDTDIQITRGYMAHRGVLGHEFVADVLESSDPTWLGKRVVGDINAGCGACDDCLTRDGHHCSRRTVLGIAGRDGALAERLTLPERNLVAVPDHVSDDAAVFAEPLAAAAHGLDDLGDDDGIVVLGDGKLGLLTVMCLRASSRPVTLIGHHDENLQIARGIGAEVVNARNTGLEAWRGVGAVVEATGRVEGLESALQLVRPRGTVVLKTTVANRFEIDLAPIVINELKIIGSRCGDVGHAIALLAAGKVDPTALIRSRFPLDDAEKAIERASRPATLKVLVDGLSA
jgi:threonine dehydrogenase-like Zn-dependent dehydrogenase